MQIEDRIAVLYNTDDDGDVAAAVVEWADYIKGETLADRLEASGSVAGSPCRVGDSTLQIEVAKLRS